MVYCIFDSFLCTQLVTYFCSCLIARNLLSGFRTCLEVSIFMHDAEASMPNRSIVGPCSFMEDNGKADTDQSVSIKEIFYSLFLIR